MDSLSRDSSSSSGRSGRSFATAVASLSCVYHLLVALSCAYLPDDPLCVVLGVSVYAWAGTGLSGLGLAGIVTKRPLLVTALSHFLLLDTLVSAACRGLVLHFFMQSFHDHSICRGNDDDPTWSPPIVARVRHPKGDLWPLGHEKRCRFAVGAVQAVLVTLLICLTAAQGSLAVAVRRYGKELDGRRMHGTRVRVAVMQKPRWSPQPDPETAEM